MVDKQKEREGGRGREGKREREREKMEYELFFLKTLDVTSTISISDLRQH